MSFSTFVSRHCHVLPSALRALNPRRVFTELEKAVSDDAFERRDNQQRPKQCMLRWYAEGVKFATSGVIASLVALVAAITGAAGLNFKVIGTEAGGEHWWHGDGRHNTPAG